MAVQSIAARRSSWRFSMLRGRAVEQLMVVVEQVGRDQRSALEPRHPPHAWRGRA